MQSPPGEVRNSSQFTTAAKLMLAAWLWPFKVAVTVMLWLLLTDPELAEKDALLWPAGTVTLPGTDSKPLLLASEMMAALVVAVFNFTVQVADWLLAIAEGAQESDMSWTVGLTLAAIVNVWETPFRVAVSKAV